MAIMTFNLEHGFKVGENTHFEVGLRELTAADIYQAQLESEHVKLIGNRPFAYTSNVEMGMRLLCRQVEFIGAINGPFEPKELLKLHTDDFNILQKKASELDSLMLPDEVMNEVSNRGED
ncbi:phage tail assembly protein [Vibrio cholerae]|uniref:phage tail assembly protein n=1 Tax=Vibrio cholerae TaxID=666 RepID=UPI0001A326F5|nr:phage tail assembly protein [Vibrio cholerae]EEO13801.1 hypothetical protein VCB_002515 [Vibrio cholerae TMA 21]ELT7224141.1 phage tail assembly protein [Vibrio cholerae]MBY3693891.1 hypothetical protein [Vibrio cholerae]